MRNSNLLPSWEELLAADLVYTSSTRNEKVVSLQTILLIVRLLNANYSTDYVFSGNVNQHEFTEAEYYKSVEYNGPRFFSLITYEQQAKEAEIRARILQSVKRQSSN